MYYYLGFLYTATPPYIPSLRGPDDTSHFEQLKPQHGMSHSSSYKSSRNQYGFNGQSLHFVGFTHSKFPAIAITPDNPLPVTTVRSVCTFVCMYVCVCVCTCVCVYMYMCVCTCVCNVCVCVCTCMCACGALHITMQVHKN